MKGTHTKQSATAATDAYDPVLCPEGDPHKLCTNINVWGEAWRVWGEEVRAELKRLGGGGPDPVSPPPKPPFQ